MKISEVPTVPRIKQLLVKENDLYQFYPGRSVIALGTGQSICGVTITIFGVLTYPLESSPINIYSVIWIGLIIIVSGLLSVISGRNDLSLILLKINFASSIATTAAISFVTLLTVNSLLCDHKDWITSILTASPTTATSNDLIVTDRTDGKRDFISISTGDNWRPLDLQRPIVIINCIILAISSLSCLLSLINFWLTVRALISYYSHTGSTVLGLREKRQVDVDGIKRRDRIVNWIIEQSAELQSSPYCLAGNGNYRHNYNGLKSSSSTISTRIYSYGRTIP